MLVRSMAIPPQDEQEHGPQPPRGIRAPTCISAAADPSVWSTRSGSPFSPITSHSPADVTRDTFHMVPGLQLLCPWASLVPFLPSPPTPRGEDTSFTTGHKRANRSQVILYVTEMGQ